MPVDGQFANLFEISGSFFTKAFLILFLIFYAVFSLILYRQVQIMSRKLPTALSPILKFVGIIHIGVSLALLFLVAGSF